MAKAKGSAEKFPRAGGVYAALATPRQPGGTDVDTASLLDYLDTVVRAGVDGLVLFGSTGEFIHFDVADRIRAAAYAIRRSRVPVLVNASHSTVARAITLAEAALASGASGVLLMPPYFYRYTQDQISQFYQECASALASQIPIYLYNLPSSTNCISAELANRLLSSGKYAGIKDSSGDWEMLQFLLDLRQRHPFVLLAGSEDLFLRARPLGLDGTISGISGALPELLVALNRSIPSQLDRAQRFHSRVEELLVWVRQFPSTVAIKQIAVARKWRHNHFAIPPDPITASLLAEFQAWLTLWLPAVLSECADKGQT